MSEKIGIPEEIRSFATGIRQLVDAIHSFHHDVVELKEKGRPNPPPLFRLPNGIYINPFDVLCIRHHEAYEAGLYGKAAPARVIVDYGDPGMRNGVIVSTHETYEEAIVAAENLGQRINQARSP